VQVSVDDAFDGIFGDYFCKIAVRARRVERRVVRHNVYVLVLGSQPRRAIEGHFEPHFFTFVDFYILRRRVFVGGRPAARSGDNGAVEFERVVLNGKNAVR
jgi:hypothetical protein